MIVRKIRPEEVKRTMELFAISFEFANNIEKSAQEIYEEVMQAISCLRDIERSNENAE